jgi:hypothetical protein
MDQNKWPSPWEYEPRRPNPILPVLREIFAPVTLPASLADHIDATRQADR